MFNICSILVLAMPAIVLVLATGFSTSAHAADTVRARDLGVPFSGTPGPLNAITDVKGLEVGQVTLVEGKGALEVGKRLFYLVGKIQHPRFLAAGLR